LKRNSIMRSKNIAFELLTVQQGCILGPGRCSVRIPGEVLRTSPSPQANTEMEVGILGQNRFLSNPFQLICHHSTLLIAS
jgi:hypothetical protein